MGVLEIPCQFFHFLYLNIHGIMNGLDLYVVLQNDKHDNI